MPGGNIIAIRYFTATAADLHQIAFFRDQIAALIANLYDIFKARQVIIEPYGIMLDME